MIRRLPKYNCSKETFDKKISDLKKVIILKEEYERIKNSSLEDRLKIIDQISTVFPDLDEYKENYRFLLLRGANDEELKDVYHEINPIGELLKQFDSNLELHKLRFQIVKANLIDIYSAIKTGYFKDGTKFKYEIHNKNGGKTTRYNWLEFYKRLPFIAEDRIAYFNSCIRIKPNLNRTQTKPYQRICEFLFNVFEQSDDIEDKQISANLRRFILENKITNLNILSEEKMITECVIGEQTIKIPINNKESATIIITESEKKEIFDYMKKCSYPLLTRVYNELLNLYIRIKHYCNNNIDLIKIIFFENCPFQLSLMERVSVLEYLIENKLPVTLEEYNKQAIGFIIRKECYRLANKNTEYTDQEFLTEYKGKAKKTVVTKAIADLKKATLILINSDLSFIDKVFGIFEIYISKIDFEKKTNTLRNHLLTDKKLEGFDNLIGLLDEFFASLYENNQEKIRMAKLMRERQLALDYPEINDAYNLISLYITSAQSKDEDIFCEGQGITEEQLEKSAKLIKKLWPELYEEYSKRRAKKINSKIKKELFDFLKFVELLQTKKFSKPSDILAELPLKDNYSQEKFERIARIIDLDYTLESIESFFGFKRATNFQKIKVTNKDIDDEFVLLNPKSVRGRILAIARCLKHPYYQDLDNFFQESSVSIEDTLQDSSTERQKLYTTYKNSIIGMLPARNICGFNLEACQLRFSEKEVTEILDYMEYRGIPYRDDTFKLVAQEYKTGIITKQELETLKERYTKKLTNQKK